jgi:conjugative transfer signal peptidase TraF
MLFRKSLPWRRIYRSIGAPLLLLFLFYLFVWMAHSQGYRLNLSRSMPLGLYKVQPIKTSLKRGDLVVFCLSAEQIPKRLILPKSNGCPSGTLPFLKTIVGVPGDYVETLSSGVFVNGDFVPESGCSVEAQLPCIKYRQTLPSRGYWVFGSGASRLLAAYSFDSRYFGPIDLDLIQGVAQPL